MLDKVKRIELIHKLMMLFGLFVIAIELLHKGNDLLILAFLRALGAVIQHIIILINNQ